MKIAWIVIVLFILVLVLVYVPITSYPFNSSDAVCVNGEVKIKSSGNVLEDMFIGSSTDVEEMRAGLTCVLDGGNDAKYKITCVNGKPTTICKSRLYKSIFDGNINFYLIFEGIKDDNPSINKINNVPDTSLQNENPPKIPNSNQEPEMVEYRGTF